MNNRKFALLPAAKKQRKLAAVLRHNMSDADLQHRSVARQYRLLTERKSSMLWQKHHPNYQIPMPTPTPETEADLLRRAFGLIQRRITEHLAGAYPEARWVWETPNAQAHIAAGDPVHILLNRAGGYRRAEVQISQLQYKSLKFDSVPEPAPPPPAEPEPPEESDYSLLAFEWVEAHLLALNERCGSDDEITIPADELPDPASWPEICAELMRNGFACAEISHNGITITLEQ